MSKGQSRYRLHVGWLSVFSLMIGLDVQGQSVAPTPVHEYVFLIDTSSSMEDGQRVAPLRVAVDDYARTIPIDGSSQIWIMTFDRGIRESFQRPIKTTDDLTAARVFLASQKYAGTATYIYKSLDEVLGSIEKLTKDGRSHDIVIHLFTDGDDNGPRRPSFETDMTRFAQIRSASGKQLEFYYHTLDVELSANMRKLIEQTEGVHHVPGIGLPPRAMFVPSAMEAGDNTPLTFVNNTVGNAQSWSWDFGDTATSDEKSPTHTYKAPGEYAVRLTAVNPSGKSAAQCTIIVKGGPPKAKFVVEEPEKPKYAGTAVRFRDQSEGRATSWSWDFGDGQGKSQDRNPTYTYRQAGTFKVVLALVGPFGKDEASTFVKVSQPDVVAFSFFPDPPKHGQDVKFSNESVGEYRAWQWDFGDGGLSQERSPTHVFADVGTRTVTLSAESVDGGKRGAQKVVKVVSADERAEARFVLPVTSVEIGRMIAPTDESTGSITRWEWDMGDGTTVEGRKIRHAFMKAGTYKITLSVSGPLNTNQAQATVSVVEPNWRIAISPTPVAMGREATFALENAPAYVAAVVWDFGDGSKPVRQGAGVLAQHVYQAEGKFAVKATVALQDGSETAARLERTLAAEVVVHGETVGVQFGATSDRAVMGVGAEGTRKLRGPVPLKVRFEDQSTGPVATRAWDFGDGGKSDDRTPARTYASPGTYRARLTVTDYFGRSHTSTDSQGLSIEVIGWRPPRSWRWPFILLFGVALTLLWRICPWQRRKVLYKLGDSKKSFRSWSRDLTLKSETSSATLRLRRNGWLRKYYTLEAKGAVQWLNRKGEKPDRRGEVWSSDTLKVGDQVYALLSLNRSGATGFRSLAIVMLVTATAAWLTWPVFF